MAEYNETSRMTDSSIPKYYRTFSGTDALVFALLPQTKPIVLGSLTTFSYSMFRDKKPVPLIGKVNVGGFTRGTRIYAGTMVFTLINQHWVNELLDQAPWLKKFGKLKADELPLFDLMIICANEYGSAVQMFIYGVDITDEGQVLSIEDIFTENTFSFVARDLTNFTGEALGNGTEGQASATIRTLTDFDIRYDKDLNAENLRSYRTDLKRNLALDPANTLNGQDVRRVQDLLRAAGDDNLVSTGIYDTRTYDAVRAFQSSQGLRVSGGVDDETYQLLQAYEAGVAGRPLTNPSAVVTNKSGALVYESPSVLSAPLVVYPYKDDLVIEGEDGDWYQTRMGYVSKYDVYAYGNQREANTYPELREGDKGALVSVLQKALNSLADREYISGRVVVNGLMDEATIVTVKETQRQSGLTADGVVDREVWQVLEGEAGLEKQEQSNGVQYLFLKQPGKSTLTYQDNMQELCKAFGMDCITKTVPQVVRVSAVAKYANGKQEVFTKEITVPANSFRSMTLQDVQDALLYNPDQGGEPVQLELIIYPQGETPWKWTIETRRNA